MRREAVVRQGLVVGEREQRQVARHEERKLRLEPLELRGILGKHRQWTAGTGGHLGEREGQRGALEPLPTCAGLQSVRDCES